MKKILCLLLTFLLLLPLFASCTAPEQKKDNGKLKILCTIFPQYDFVKNIVKDLADVSLLIPPGSETHSFSLSNLPLNQVDALFETDLLVYVGGVSDVTLLSDLQKTLQSKNVKYLSLMELSSEKLEETVTPGMEEHHHEGQSEHHHDGMEIDEHLWTSPKRAMEFVSGISEEICKLDEKNREQYEKNTALYLEKLKELDASLEDVVKNSPLDTLIFADRFPFRYLCHDYHLHAFAAFTGCSSAVDPNLTTLDFLYNKAKELQAPGIFYMENSKSEYAKELAKKVNGQALLLHSCHIVTEEELKTESYLSLMEKNIENLKIALGYAK